MKKQTFPVLLAITCMFLSFTAGFFIGRNSVHGSVQVSTPGVAPVYADKVPVSTSAESTVPPETVHFPVDINTAAKEELMALPGIGEELAQRILDYGAEYGNYAAPEELLNVSGIGAGKLEAILDLIATGGLSP